MTVINIRPVGWGGMTPRQWSAVRAMILSVVAVTRDPFLFVRAGVFLAKTEGYDV